jgi:hypothetical protein
MNDISSTSDQSLIFMLQVIANNFRITNTAPYFDDALVT